jgi:hypothetical protein
VNLPLQQSKAVVDQEIAEQHDSFKEQFDAVVCDLDSERAVIDLLTSEKESKEKQLTSQLEERDTEIAEGAARIVELEAALAFETTRRYVRPLSPVSQAPTLSIIPPFHETQSPAHLVAPFYPHRARLLQGGERVDDR